MHQRLHAYEKHKENQENRGNGEGGKEWRTHIHYPVKKKIVHMQALHTKERGSYKWKFLKKTACLLLQKLIHATLKNNISKRGGRRGRRGRGEV